MFSLDYNFWYENMSKYIIWFGYLFATLIPDEVNKLHAKITQLPPMNMALFQQQLTPIDQIYPLSLPSGAILSFQVITGAILLGTIAIAIWHICKKKKDLKTLFNVVPDIKNLIGSDPKSLINSLKDMLLSPSMKATVPEAGAHQWKEGMGPPTWAFSTKVISVK